MLSPKSQGFRFDGRDFSICVSYIKFNNSIYVSRDKKCFLKYMSTVISSSRTRSTVLGGGTGVSPSLRTAESEVEWNGRKRKTDKGKIVLERYVEY